MRARAVIVRVCVCPSCFWRPNSGRLLLFSLAAAFVRPFKGFRDLIPTPKKDKSAEQPLGAGLCVVSAACPPYMGEA